MKSVLVTGGCIRIGLAIANRLRSEGWRVLVSSHRKGNCADLVADFSRPMEAVRLYASAMDLLGGIPPDALVNNAAVFSGESDFVNAINYEAPRKLTMLMSGRENGVGSVVNVLDSTALRTDVDKETPYLLSKRALLQETYRAAEMFSETLRVNAVAPGPVLAPVGTHALAGDMLLSRRPAAEDVAEAVSYLLNAQSVTGVVLPVDSGQHRLGMMP